MQRHFIVFEVYSCLFFEFSYEPVHNFRVEIIAAEIGIAVC
ncbi:hypothetical protein MCHI_002561 [Candidatus Magnetoovum chiemensis]|nr:hypothetical protein MCHI_002561 [Candidatus Magnetoovum chiemensis]